MRSPARRPTAVTRLLDRVTQQRRAAAPEAEPAGEHAGHGRRIRVLEERIEHLEALIEGLQDSVHREAVRSAGDTEEDS